MGEIKGAIVSATIFAIFVLPFLFMLLLSSIHTTSFMKHTTDFTILVAENGNTALAQQAKAQLTKKRKDGSKMEITVTGGHPGSRLGDPITINYTYSYTPIVDMSWVKGDREREVVLKRTDTTQVKQRVVK